MKTKAAKHTRDEKTIRAMVKCLVEQFAPERIILFGSRARGDAGPDSDVDLLVVLRDVASKREMQIKMRVALSSFEMPIDVIVTTPEEYAWRKEYPGTVERPAALEGKTLYARA